MTITLTRHHLLASLCVVGALAIGLGAGFGIGYGTFADNEPTTTQQGIPPRFRHVSLPRAPENDCKNDYYGGSEHWHSDANMDVDNTHTWHYHTEHCP